MPIMSFLIFSGGRKYGIRANPEEEALERVNQVTCKNFSVIYTARENDIEGGDRVAMRVGTVWMNG